MTILKAPKFPTGLSIFGKNKYNLRLLIKVYADFFRLVDLTITIEL